MRRTLVLLLLCSLFCMMSSCGDAAAEHDISSAVTVGSEAVSEESGYAIVDWMIFIRYNGRSYTRDFAPPTVLDEAVIGEQLGTVTGKPPSPVPMEYVYNVPDLTAFGYPIGTCFFAVNGMRREYAIAVYDASAGEYHLLCYEDTLPLKTQIRRCGLSEDCGYPAVRLFEAYEELPASHREQFPEYDSAFFNDNVLAVIYLEEGSGSVSHTVTMMRRVGETIEIHVRRDVPPVGTADMAYWTIAAAISREDWDGASIVPRVSGYAEFPITAADP